MRNFWLGFAWISACWIVYFITMGTSAFTVGGLIGCIAFFAIYFLADLTHNRPRLYAMLLIGALLSVFAVSFLSMGFLKDASEVSKDMAEVSDLSPVWFPLLIGSFLTWRSASRLSGVWVAAVGVSALGLPMLLMTMAGRWVLLSVILLYAAAFAFACAVHHRTSAAYEDAALRYDALLDEYRHLKRRAKHNEDAARIEERTNIARQIHDSVGHKLTSMLMQLEMFRMQAEDEKLKSYAEQMKRLAQESLQETRNAVKALKEEEPGGLQALIRLIRNLEAENYMQVEFVVRHGALSVSLNNEQSIAVFRSIQEAITNAMRHGSSRKVSILLESPGGSVFRFEVTNEVHGQEEGPVLDGFGLSAMRDRVERAGGTLEIARTRNLFVVRGSFMLHA